MNWSSPEPDQLGPPQDRLDRLLDVGVVAVDPAGLLVGVELGPLQPHARDQQGRQAPAQRPRGERRDGQGLDVVVERGVVVLEPLVVRQVAGPGPVVDGEDQARKLPADPAGRLDVLGRRLGLTGDDHQAEPLHVHADRDHVGRQQHVEGPLGHVLEVPLLAPSPSAWLRSAGRTPPPGGRARRGCRSSPCGRSVRRPSTSDRAASPRWSIFLRRVRTSSSTSRRIPPSSRIELK